MSAIIPQRLGDRPKAKYINEHVIEKICAAGPEVWRDLGAELLQEESFAILQLITAGVTKCSVCCSVMFKLWFEEPGMASWSNLVVGLKQIRQTKLASDIKNLLSVESTTVDQDESTTVDQDEDQDFGKGLSLHTSNEDNDNTEKSEVTEKLPSSKDTELKLVQTANKIKEESCNSVCDIDVTSCGIMCFKVDNMEIDLISVINIKDNIFVWSKKQKSETGGKIRKFRLRSKFLGKSSKGATSCNMNIVNGHQFMAVDQEQFSCCSHCGDFIWGIVNVQGYQCAVCKLLVHEKCHKNVVTSCGDKGCPESLIAKTNKLPDGARHFNFNIPHQFNIQTYKIPTFCNHCGSLLQSQGLKCEACGVKCHQRCQQNMAHTCGINSKELSDLFEQIQPNPEKLSDEIKQQSPVISKELNLTSSVPVTLPSAALPVEDMLPSDSGKKSTLEGFQFVKMLGKGSIAKVMLAEHKSTGNMYAIKVIKKKIIIEEDMVEDALIERKVLAFSVQHPFLTALHSCFQTKERLFFVMKYIPGGDLMFWIIKLGKFNENTARFYSAEIISALLFLHSMGIIYRDLKLDNVMLDHDGHVKLVDFNTCKEGILNGRTTRTFIGTPDYIAPEIISYQPYGASVDWWSLGVLMYEMMAGRPPFDGDDDDELFNNIMTRQVQYPKSMSQEAVNIIRGFLTKSPTKRLGCQPGTGEKQIKDHEFFKSIDWVALENKKVTPPLIPMVKGKHDVSNFDNDFTSEAAQLSPLPQSDGDIDQNNFSGFSYVNPKFNH